MDSFRHSRLLGTLALLATWNLGANAQEVKKVFVIAMENHNWTQPANQFNGGIQQIYLNSSAPFINSLVDGTGWAEINGRQVHISEDVAYASAYHNVLATSNGSNPHIHPSEPNYIWAEAGDNFGVANDNDPFATNGPTDQNTSAHLVTQLTKAGKTWKSYQEDTEPLRHLRQRREPVQRFQPVQLRRQAQPHGLLHRLQRRQRQDRVESAGLALRSAAAALLRS